MIKVAIVEDDPLMLDRLVTAITAADDLEVVAVATNAAKGRALVSQGGYDVLLCDLGLPDGNGIDLIRAEAASGRDTDILVITLFASQAKVMDSIRAGARGYVLKDSRIGDCVTAIREISAGGSPISPVIARHLLREIRPDSHTEDVADQPQLSEREFEVLNSLSRGFSYVECGEILGVSANTIGSHVKNIYRKLEVNSRAEALFEASNRGLLRRG